MLCCEAVRLRRKKIGVVAGFHKKICVMAYCSMSVRPVNRHHCSDLKKVGMTWQGREGRQICTNIELCIDRISVGYQSAVSRSLNFAESEDLKFKSVEIRIYCEVREKTNKMQQLDVYYQYFLNMFRASLCPYSGEQDVCYCTWCAAL